MNSIVKKYSILVIFLLLLVTQLSGQFYYGTQMTFGKNRVQFNDFYWYFYRYEKFDAYFNQSGKAIANYTADFLTKEIEHAEEFLSSFLQHAGISLVYIIKSRAGDTHHVLEALFKAFGKALDNAAQIDSRRKGVPSTKGIID